MNLVFPSGTWHQLRALSSDSNEVAGVALANVVERDGRPRLLVRHIRTPNPSHYQRRGPLEVTLDPTFVAAVTKEARDAGMALVFFHTHPGSLGASFSPVDDAGEHVLKEFLARRAPTPFNIALVISRAAQSARLLGSNEPVSITTVGSEVLYLGADENNFSANVDDLYDRQIRAIGHASQGLLRTLRLGVVGLGGTGSIAIEQLAHLGVPEFVFIDPDVVERSNLNRVVGASITDLGRPKVDVAADLVARIQPSANIRKVQASILRSDVLRELRNVDAVFCCTDSHGSRYVLNEFAYRFLVPCFDCGVVVVASQRKITHIAARIQMLAPGLSCLTCSRTLDSEQVRRDLLTDFERSQDPYIQGASLPEPAVISLNGTAVSLAVTMFLSAFCGFPSSPRHQRYDAIRGTVRAIDTTPTTNCITCSTEGAVAVGDSWPLPGR